MRFEHETLGQRVRFVTEAADGVAREVEALGSKRVMVIAGPIGWGSSGGSRRGCRWPSCTMRSSWQRAVQVAERELEAASANDVDALVNVRGGSATGLAKAVALTTGLPIVAVRPPTLVSRQRPSGV